MGRFPSDLVFESGMTWITGQHLFGIVLKIAAVHLHDVARWGY